MDSSRRFLLTPRSAASDVEGRGIAFRLSILILVTTSAIFVGLFGYYYAFSRRVIAEKIEENATLLARSTANRIDEVLGATAKLPAAIAEVMEHFPSDPARLDGFVSSLVKSNREVYGVAVAFEPYAYHQDLKSYAPYWQRRAGEIDVTGIAYDYFSWDWFQIPRELGRGVWIEPYFDEGAGDALMSTCSFPFYQQTAAGRSVKGVVTADVSLLWLRQIVSSTKIGKTGYAFLLSKNGTFVTHPNPDLIMNESIFGLAEATGDHRLREIGRAMIAGESGFVSSVNMISGVRGSIAYAPLPSAGWSLAVIFPQHEMMADISRLNRRVALLGIGGIVLLYLVIRWIARGITRPLRDLTAAAASISGGNLDAALPPVRAHDEVGALTASFHSMKDALKEHIRNLTETTAAKERIESELRLAHDIQMGILPRIFPPFPDRNEVDLYAEILPAKEVGGDLYDFFFMDDRHLCFIIGDVSGKGVPASLFMAITKMLVKAKAVKGLTPDAILTKVNDDISLDNPSMMFVTLFLGILDVTSGELVYSNGGHNPPYVMRGDGRIATLESTKGIALGVVEGAEFQSRTIALDRGDRLFLYTDGITEAVSRQSEFFTEIRLEKGLALLKGLPLEELIAGIMKEVETFALGAPQADDITIMALEFKG